MVAFDAGKGTFDRVSVHLGAAVEEMGNASSAFFWGGMQALALLWPGFRATGDQISGSVEFLKTCLRVEGGRLIANQNHLIFLGIPHWRLVTPV